MTNFFWCEKCKTWVSEISTVTTTVRRCPHCNNEIKPYFYATYTSTEVFDKNNLNDFIEKGVCYMKKYLDSDKLLSLLPELHELNYKYDEGYNACLKQIKEIIQATDTIMLGNDMLNGIIEPLKDVEPVKHGHWEPFEKEGYWIQDIEEIYETGKPTKQIQYRCSHCLSEFGTIVVEQNYMYCPKCGAKWMRIVR